MTFDPFDGSLKVLAAFGLGRPIEVVVDVPIGLFYLRDPARRFRAGETAAVAGEDVVMDGEVWARASELTALDGCAVRHVRTVEEHGAPAAQKA